MHEPGVSVQGGPTSFWLHGFEPPNTASSCDVTPHSVTFQPAEFNLYSLCSDTIAQGLYEMGAKLIG